LAYNKLEAIQKHTIVI